MSPILNLHARPGDGAELSLWRIGVTNSNTVVDLAFDPALAGVTAVASTDGSGDDQGRIDISVPVDAPAGAYEWTAEIDSVVVWVGTVYIAPHGRPASFLAHSIDIRSLTSPAWIIPRAEDVAGEALGGGPATQIEETSGPTILDISAVSDGEYLQRVGEEIVGATPAGTGDVTAAIAFGTTNRMVVSDGVGKGVKASGVTLNGTTITGVTALTTADLTATGTISGISAADVGADVAGTAATEAANAIAAHVGDGDPHGQYQLMNAKGVVDGYASLDGDGYVIEPALTVTDGTTDYTFGALTDTQFLYLDGSTIKTKIASGAGDVVGPSGSAVTSVPVLDATGKVLSETPMTVDPITGAVDGVGDLTMTGDLSGANSVTAATGVFTDLTATGVITGISAADVGADAAGTAASAVAAHIAAGDPHIQYQKESERGAASGYASLDADTRLVEAAQLLRVTGQDLSAGAVSDGQYFVRSGTTYSGITPDLDTWVPGTATASQVPRRNAGDSAFEWATLTAADVSAIPLSQKGAASGVATLDSSTRLVEAAQVLRVTGQDLTAGAVTDGQYIIRSGTTYAGITPDLGTWVPGTAAASQVPRRNSGNSAFEWATLTAADVSALATSAKGAASGVASLDSNTRLVEAAQVLRVTGQDLTAGAASDGQFLTRSGTTYAGVTHDGTGDPHGQYQLESEKGSADGYAGLDSSSFVAQAAPIIRATGVSLTVGSVSDGQMLVRSGSTIVGAAAATDTKQRAVLGSDFSTSGSGAAVTGWSSLFTITAGKNYKITLFAQHQAAATTTVAQLALDWSQTPQSVQWMVETAHNSASSAYSAASVNADNTYGNTGTNTGSANTNFAIAVRGIFKANASTGGNLTVNLRSSDGTTQVTLKAGGYIEIDQLD